ncbi:MAG: hypothetical protein AB7Q16_05970 [Vicinamibacterales bacterium]
MPAGFTIAKLEGRGGEVWIGKAVRAAALESWIATPGPRPGSWEFSAHLGERDAYYITQAPDTVRLPFGPKELRWSGALEIAGDRVRATFDGPPEER